MALDEPSAVYVTGSNSVVGRRPIRDISDGTWMFAIDIPNAARPSEGE